MWTTDRRTFLTCFSRSLIAAGVGASAAGRAAWALAARGEDPLSFGEREELVALMQETAPAELQELLVRRLQAGTGLSELVAAGALANARTFGGHDYTGYHCMMALVPALAMARLLPERAAPLPVLKVLYRNADRIQAMGGRSDEALHEVPEAAALGHEAARARLREAYLERDVESAEAAFAALVAANPARAYDDVQSILRENLDVHRVVLAWRAWETLDVTGPEHALTLLRQTVRFCIDAEQKRIERGRPEPELRTLLPDLMARCELEEGAHGTTRLSDEELEELCHVVFSSTKPDAARSVARCLAGGTAPEDVGEAISLAANKLLIQDPGRRRDDSPEKPRGSVHGASIGVHASDAARAWRCIGRVSNPRNAAANLIAGAYHTAGQSEYVGDAPFPYREHAAEVKSEDPTILLEQLREALVAGEQGLSCAVTERYCELGLGERPLFDLLLELAVEADGALHAEKYYHTVCEDFREARPAFRKNHLLTLARVTASESAWEAPGVAAARERLGV